MQMIDIDFTEEEIKKFHSYYDKTSSCWIFNGYRQKSGHGHIRFRNVTHLAHQVAYVIFKGKYSSHLCVLHTCDNGSCVNPDHLFLGTKMNNMEDKVNKNRQTKGIFNGGAVLAEEEVLEIKRLYLTGEYTQKVIAKKFGVSQSQISRLINCLRQGHIV